MAELLRKPNGGGKNSGPSKTNGDPAAAAGMPSQKAVASQIFRSMKAWRDREDEAAGGDAKATEAATDKDDAKDEKSEGDAALGEEAGTEKVQAKKISRSEKKEASGLDKLNNGAGAGLEMAATGGKVAHYMPHEVAEGLGAAHEFLGKIGSAAMWANIAREWALAVAAIQKWRAAVKAAKTTPSKKADETAAKAAATAAVEVVAATITTAVSMAMKFGGAAKLGALLAGAGAWPAVIMGVAVGAAIFLVQKYFIHDKLHHYLEKKFLAPLKDSLSQPDATEQVKEGESAELAEAAKDAETVGSESDKAQKALEEATKVEPGKVAPGNLENHDRQQAANAPNAEALQEGYLRGA